MASTCLHLNVYILRPLDHSEKLLANAQYDWLRKEGQMQGWRPVKDGLEAQELANEGELVVVAFKEADATKHGHIAIVRPSTRVSRSFTRSGPEIIQAGTDNFQSTSVKEGFHHHKSAWPKGVRYYARGTSSK